MSFLQLFLLINLSAVVLSKSVLELHVKRYYSFGFSNMVTHCPCRNTLVETYVNPLYLHHLLSHDISFYFYFLPLLFLCKVKNETQALADSPNHIRLLIKKKSPQEFHSPFFCSMWLVAIVDRRFATERSSKPRR